LDSGSIKGLAHITGGGLTENIPRILPLTTAVEINKSSWPVLPVFTLMQQLGNVPEPEMFRTFNMGVGMVIICARQNAEAIRSHFQMRGQPCFSIGSVTSGHQEVKFL
ncbi:MAG: AIR synthase-related protein, partial [Pyrinomonadaceae bacterium]